MLQSKLEKSIDAFMAGCIVAALAVIIMELTLPLPAWAEHAVPLVNSTLFSIFLVHLLFKFFSSFDKRSFLKKNWLLIACYLPIGIGIMRIRKIPELVRLLCHTKDSPTMQDIPLAGIPLLGFGKGIAEITQAITLGKTEKSLLSGKPVLVNLYVSPAADAHAAKGIEEGITYFIRARLKCRPMIARKDWLCIHKLEQDLLHDGTLSAEDLMGNIALNQARYGLNVYITQETLDFSESMTEFCAYKRPAKESPCYLFSASAISGYAEKYPCEHHKQKSLKGFIIGYNALARRYSSQPFRRKCTEHHCIHGPVTHQNIDLLSFLFSMNRRSPICEAHSS